MTLHFAYVTGYGTKVSAPGTNKKQSRNSGLAPFEGKGPTAWLL